MTLTAAVLVAAFGCATPGPVPTPINPTRPPPFVCAGPSSVPDFDDVANALVLAAQERDDADALAGIDKVAATSTGGASAVRCAINAILPDLRAAPITGIHLEEWEARNSAASGAGPR